MMKSNNGCVVKVGSEDSLPQSAGMGCGGVAAKD